MLEFRIGKCIKVVPYARKGLVRIKDLTAYFSRRVQMLKDADIEIDLLGDLKTKTERKLGKLVLEKSEEIISGSECIYYPDFLTTRGIDAKTIETYIDSFRYGVPPHGGFGAEL